MRKPLPPHMATKWGHLPHLRYKGSGFWVSACPVCGDSGHREGSGPPDRFFMQDKKGTINAHGKCRRCGVLQWLDADAKPDPVKIAQEEEIRRRDAEEEAERISMLVSWLNDQAFWRGFAEGMTTSQRQLWRAEGIPEWAIESHKLGFNADYHYGPALSIPYFGRDWTTVETLQYRLLEPENPSDKYRFMKGLGPRWFRPWPETEDKKVVLILEGAKKALVAYDRANTLRYRGAEVSWLASPQDKVPEALVPELEEFETILWCLDPDTLEKRGKAAPAIERNIDLVGPDRSRVVRLPGKVDDLFTQYGLRPETFVAIVNQAMPWDRRNA